jgi:hypothetical protein
MTEEAKKISISVRGQGEDGSAIRDLEIDPGTEKKDILEALNLSNEFQLFRRKTNSLIEDGIDLYSTLDQYEKLEASMAATLGRAL